MFGPLVLTLGALAPRAADDPAKELLPPVRLEAAGKPIDTDVGHAAPFVADFDGDGVKDLLVGQFGDGVLWVYRNVGTNDHPRFAAGVKFKGGNPDGRVPTGWCVGFGPQLVDLDGDGRLDLISGSWPGEIFFFKGKGKGEFGPPVKLKDKSGKTINVGGGVRKDSGDMILVAGDARFETKDKKTFLIYEGERIEVPEGKQAGITGTASAVHATDWDGDGRIDLLVGDIGGNVYLLRNEGTRGKYAFGKERQLTAGGKPLRVDGDAGPFACDWDGDGKVDLLVGAGDGSVWFYRNVGTAKAPELAAGVRLVPPGEARFGADAPKGPRRGIRAKVCAVDWDGDGRLDLLVGDFTTQRPDRPEPTAEQKAEHAKLRKELESVQGRYGELITKLQGPSRAKAREERDKLQKDFQEVARRMREIQAKLPPDYENHGWVWLFLRKPAETKAGAR